MASSTRGAADFLFFGAGDAAYFEWAELAVRFRRPPTESEQARILAGVPTPLAPMEGDDEYGGSEATFAGRMLVLSSEQFINLSIELTYGSADVDVEALGAEHVASAEALAAFEAHIETWLKEAHAICPIEFACRGEDDEAGGTALSQWHEDSVEALPGLLAQWEADPATFSQDEEENDIFGGCLGMLLYFGQIEPDAVPPRLAEAFPFD